VAPGTLTYVGGGTRNFIPYVLMNSGAVIQALWHLGHETMSGCKGHELIVKPAFFRPVIEATCLYTLPLAKITVWATLGLLLLLPLPLRSGTTSTP